MEQRNFKEILKKVKERFSIQIDPRLSLEFIHLPKKKDPSNFQRFTLVAESFDTIKLAWYGLNQWTPDLFIDTTGCAFTFLVAKLMAGCKIVAYVHYPTISTDMLQLVWEKRPSYNHHVTLSQSTLATYSKLLYYCIFAIMYGLVGSLADLVMVNSTWTRNHISYLWRFSKGKRIHVVYPPCDTESFRKFHNVDHDDATCSRDTNMILSIGQFRPEKDHALQIRAFAKLKKLVSTLPGGQDLQLVLVGSCRGKQDEERVSYLMKLAESESLRVHQDVVFIINQPFTVLQDYFSRASIGLHTMWNEHFGIGVVEMMAAGLLTIAHDSGGPKSDIITAPIISTRHDHNHEDDYDDHDHLPHQQRTGYLASTEEQYVNTMLEAWILSKDAEQSRLVRLNAQNSSTRFSDDVFRTSFQSLILTFLLD